MVELVIPDGALNDKLKDNISAPVGGSQWDGPSSGQPSARWYLDQIDFPNADEYVINESKAFVRDNDILMLVGESAQHDEGRRAHAHQRSWQLA